MNQLLFERSTGAVGPNVFARLQTYQLLTSFALASHLSFDGGEAGLSISDGTQDRPNARSIWAHQSGVSCLAIDRFDGRVMISGGTDATIKLWDLEQSPNPHTPHVYTPAGVIPRSRVPAGTVANSSINSSSGRYTRHDTISSSSTAAVGHKFGITKISFYPFDSEAFLSSSHDGTLKLWATETAALSKTFELQDRIFTHAISPVASHLLVACGTSSPAVRLVDLRAGAAVHTLPAPGAGAMLSMAWSPRWDHVLASGSSDGVVRLWDIRRAGGPLGVLDRDDSVGITKTRVSQPPSSRNSESYATVAVKKAHTGPVNGLLFTDDGSLIVTAGHDRKIRVWDADTGANTHTAFGPLVKNPGTGAGTGGGQLGAQASMFVSPTGTTVPGREILFWGNENEILSFDLREGNVIQRLKGRGAVVAAVSAGEEGSGLASGSGSGVALASAAGGRMAGRSDEISTGLVNRNRGSFSRAGGVRVAGPSERQRNVSSPGRQQRSIKNRFTGMAWRGAGGDGQSSGTVLGGRTAAGGIFTSHLDGQIRAWVPSLVGGDTEDEDVVDGDKEKSRKRKRGALDNAFRSLMGTGVTFSGGSEGVVGDA